MPETNQRTQEMFYKCLDINLINTLLYLFTSNTFIDEILYERQQAGFDNINIDIITTVETSKIHSRSLYISFKKNEDEYLYFSLHLCPDTFQNISNKNKIMKGPIHFARVIKNTTKGKYPAIPVRVTTSENKTLLTLGNEINTKYYSFNFELIKECQIVLNIINLFLNLWPNNENVLSQSPHFLLNNTLKKMNVTKANRKNKGKYLFNNKTRKYNGTIRNKIIQ
jgi:hypothetical protein